jgi:hypothetical protein
MQKLIICLLPNKVLTVLVKMGVEISQQSPPHHRLDDWKDFSLPHSNQTDPGTLLS